MEDFKGDKITQIVKFFIGVEEVPGHGENIRIRCDSSGLAKSGEHQIIGVNTYNVFLPLDANYKDFRVATRYLIVNLLSDYEEFLPEVYCQDELDTDYTDWFTNALKDLAGEES